MQQDCCSFCIYLQCYIIITKLSNAYFFIPPSLNTATYYAAVSTVEYEHFIINTKVIKKIS